MNEFLSLKNLSVLFVEDDAYARKAMKAVLDNIFRETYIAENGIIGLEKFSENRVDIVITDLWMPEMNGFEMIAEMKKMRNNFLVVVMSAYDVPDYEKKAENLDIFGTLKKPFTLSDFEEVLFKAGEKAAAQP